ncbi:hypothetical protein VTN31DRAFT_2271 [Thermomyces dupontii]|uniref:uncharacterized protein n=1 Tax=Talaromyces thermophilus TaxID=28565 RepID=UPI003743008A
MSAKLDNPLIDPTNAPKPQGQGQTCLRKPCSFLPSNPAFQSHPGIHLVAHNSRGAWPRHQRLQARRPSNEEDLTSHFKKFFITIDSSVNNME